jgi:predicted transcriptional regulator
MHPAGKLCILVIAFIIFISAPAIADTIDQVGPYTITTGAPPGSIVDDSGADGTVSFWELPLWIQASYATGMLVGVLASVIVMVKLIPLLAVKARKMFDNRNRETIFEYIDDNPGCTVNDISRGKSLNVGSVRYHVYRMELEHKIQQVKAGKFIRIFRNNGAYDEREIVVISALNVRTSGRIMWLLRKTPGLSNKQIADRLKIKESMAHVYISHLLKDEIVRFEKQEQQKMYYLANDASDIMEKYAGPRRVKNQGTGFSGGKAQDK